MYTYRRRKKIVTEPSVAEAVTRFARPVPIPEIQITPELESALDKMENTREHIFLTGRAGTGKSTLLQYFRATTKKKMVVLAPTGVAALNVQGQTIHSFFGFRPGITPDKVKRRFDAKGKMFRDLDAIVIDEISMVRADLLDCIDAFLRLNGPDRMSPFGGIQLIMIGDLYQLPPVVTEEEASIFNSHYQSPYFFDANVFAWVKLTYIELTKVYRQNELDFIEVLDAIRMASATEEHLMLINSRHDPWYEDDDSLTIHLVSTNAMAKLRNDQKLSALSTPAVKFKGMKSGEFAEERNLPTDEELLLRPGAQVMLLNNDPKKRWVNGDIGRITEIGDASGAKFVNVELADGRVESVTPFSWEMVKYSYDETEKKIDSRVAGSFTQFPLRLAWAVTIHKGQGKTFDHVVVDFGRGTFAHGQAYVALSRSRSLQGLTLLNPIEQRHIFIDPRIAEFIRRLG
jgi:ATP-dependent DNA helicase PIF1